MNPPSTRWRGELPSYDQRRRAAYVGRLLTDPAHRLYEGLHRFYAELHHWGLMRAAKRDRFRLRAECRRRGIDPDTVWPPRPVFARFNGLQ